MNRHSVSLATALAVIGAVNSSTHRTARVLRFIHRHRAAHRRIIGQLRRRQQRHERRVNARKRRLGGGGR